MTPQPAGVQLPRSHGSWLMMKRGRQWRGGRFKNFQVMSEEEEGLNCRGVKEDTTKSDSVSLLKENEEKPSASALNSCR